MTNVPIFDLDDDMPDVLPSRNCVYNANQLSHTHNHSNSKFFNQPQNSPLNPPEDTHKWVRSDSNNILNKNKHNLMTTSNQFSTQSGYCGRFAKVTTQSHQISNNANSSLSRSVSADTNPITATMASTTASTAAHSFDFDDDFEIVEDLEEIERLTSVHKPTFSGNNSKRAIFGSLQHYDTAPSSQALRPFGASQPSQITSFSENVNANHLRPSGNNQITGSLNINPQTAPSRMTCQEKKMQSTQFLSSIKIIEPHHHQKPNAFNRPVQIAHSSLSTRIEANRNCESNSYGTSVILNNSKVNSNNGNCNSNQNYSFNPCSPFNNGGILSNTDNANFNVPNKKVVHQTNNTTSHLLPNTVSQINASHQSQRSRNFSLTSRMLELLTPQEATQQQHPSSQTIKYNSIINSQQIPTNDKSNNNNNGINYNNNNNNSYNNSNNNNSNTQPPQIYRVNHVISYRSSRHFPGGNNKFSDNLNTKTNYSDSLSNNINHSNSAQSNNISGYAHQLSAVNNIKNGSCDNNTLCNNNNNPPFFINRTPIKQCTKRLGLTPPLQLRNDSNITNRGCIPPANNNLDIINIISNHSTPARPRTKAALVNSVYLPGGASQSPSHQHHRLSLGSDWDFDEDFCTSTATFEEPRIMNEGGGGENADGLVCTICLGEDCDDEGRPNGCMHRFCFGCIKKWAEVTNLCPLCKVEFDKIRRVKRVSRTETVDVWREDDIVIVTKRVQPVPYQDGDEHDLDENWIENVFCMVCGRDDDDANLILCDGCTNAGHVRCMNLRQVPEEEWFCGECNETGENIPGLISERISMDSIQDSFLDDSEVLSSRDCGSSSNNSDFCSDREDVFDSSDGLDGRIFSSSTSDEEKKFQGRILLKNSKEIYVKNGRKSAKKPKSEIVKKKNKKKSQVNKSDNSEIKTPQNKSRRCRRIVSSSTPGSVSSRHLNSYSDLTPFASKLTMSNSQESKLDASSPFSRSNNINCSNPFSATASWMETNFSFKSPNSKKKPTSLISSSLPLSIKPSSAQQSQKLNDNPFSNGNRLTNDLVISRSALSLKSGDKENEENMNRKGKRRRIIYDSDTDDSNV